MAGEQEKAAPAREIRVPPSWSDVAARLEEASWRCLVVVGPVDAGKTTFCRYVGRVLARRWPTAAVDCDPGQASIGPPTTLALAREPRERGMSPVALRFVGSTSPVRHFLQTMAGIRRLADRALEEGFARIVLDSCGYIDNPAGREFQFQVIDLVDADHLVAFQRADEIEPLLACFGRRARPRIHRLPPAPAAIGRAQPVRQSYREGRFESYFGPAALRVLDLGGIGFHGMIPSLMNAAGWRNRLVALCDRRGFTLVLGIVEGLDLESGLMRLYSPPFELESVASVQFGSIRLERTGRQIS